MAERKKAERIESENLPEGTVVQVAESTERFSEVCLEDGTIFRMKPIVTETLRVDGQWDQDGNPVYNLRVTNLIVIVESPAELRKDGK